MNNFMRLLRHWKEHWKWLALSLLLTLGGAIGTLAVPALSQELIDLGIMGNDFDVIMTIGGYMFLAALLAATSQVLNTAIAVKFSEQTAHYLRTGAYDRCPEREDRDPAGHLKPPARSRDVDHLHPAHRLPLTVAPLADGGDPGHLFRAPHLLPVRRRPALQPPPEEV